MDAICSDRVMKRSYKCTAGAELMRRCKSGDFLEGAQFAWQVGGQHPVAAEECCPSTSVDFDIYSRPLNTYRNAVKRTISGVITFVFLLEYL
jgi:hypothetical protein